MPPIETVEQCVAPENAGPTNGELPRELPSAQDEENAIRALTHMAASEIVSAQDLRGELAAAIPGAYRLVAAVLHVHPRELTQLLAQGGVASAGLLAGLAAGLWAAAQAEHSSPLPGFLCEACLDASAVQLQPAPWGGEMGVCAACAALA